MKPTKEAVELIRQGSLAFAKMEQNGIRIDVGKLEESERVVRDKIAGMEEELKDSEVFCLWEKHFGRKSNLDSRDQLRVVVFDLLGYESRMRTDPTEQFPEGKPKVDVAALEFVDAPFVKDYLKLQKWKKLEGTYLRGIRKELVDGYLHPFFNLHTVTTFRSSSDRPNWQNMPIRDKEMGKIIRDLVIARKGRRILEVDFGTLEFKIAACKWKDKEMVRYASDPLADVHRDQACELFMISPEQVDKKTVRDWAKNRWVFPILYGSYYISCAEHIWEAINKGGCLKDGTTKVKDWLRKKGIKKLGACDPRLTPRPGTYEEHVKKCEDKFHGKFPEWAEAKEKWWNDYVKRGWFKLMTGFVCHGSYSRNFLANTDIQGPAFHCLLWCQIQMQRWLDKMKGEMDCLIIGQIHDCLMFDCPEDEIDKVLNKIYKIMTEDIREHWDWIIVPLLVEVDVTPEGGTWNDKSAWSKTGKHWEPKAA